MLARTTTIVLLMCVVAMPAARAQGRPRYGVAGKAPAPTPAPVAAPPVTYIYNGGYIVNGAPYVVQPDGSILVNFGNGYERVLRQCAQPTRPQVDPNGLDAMGRLPLPLLQPFNSGERGQVAGTMPPSNVAACYNMGGDRRPKITRY